MALTSASDTTTAQPNRAPVKGDWKIIASLFAAFCTVESATWAHCEGTAPSDAGSRSWSWWPSLQWFRQPAQNPYILELQEDPHVGNLCKVSDLARVFVETP